MSNDSSRSEQVVEGYKRHKLASSALREIHRLLQGFEREREHDRRFAVIGIIAVIAIVAAVIFYLGGTSETITLS